MNDLLVFLSYSSKDRSFVRKLDASLSGHGIPVYLDEREIKVGDSIPAKIYEGISRASHIIYVISSNSKTSGWVQEELDIAKIRQKEASGCTILPVLIEDMDIPTSVMHVKYADFVNWREPTHFVASVNTLLTAVGVEFSVPQKSDVMFYNANIHSFTKTESTMLGFSEYTSGAILADRAICNPNATVDNKIDGVRMAMKWELEGKQMHTCIEEFIGAARSSEHILESSRIKNIISDAGKLLDLLNKNSYSGNHWANYDHSYEIRDISARIGGMMQDFRLDVVSIIASGFKLERDNCITKP